MADFDKKMTRIRQATEMGIADQNRKHASRVVI
jgi:hypothetical protein